MRVRRVDPASLVAFRILFGTAMVVLVARYFAHGWIDAQFHEPRMFFPWPGLEWVRPWPRPWMHVHFGVLAALAAAIACGFFQRTAAALFCVGFSYVHAIDRTHYLNHYYLVSLLSLLLAVLPLSRAGSLDVALGRLSPWLGFPSWMLGLVRFQVGVVYFFAGVAKLQGDWLLRAQPMRLWMAPLSDLPLVGSWLGAVWLAYAASWAGMIFDLAIPFLLLWPRVRSAAFATLVAFHVITGLLFPIGLFPWLMIGCATVFLPADWPRRLLRGAPAPTGPPADPGAERLGRGAAILLAAYVAVQIAFPLRHLALPGDVLWTERGFRFAWKVMLVEKAGLARFTAREAGSERTRDLPLADYLTPVQARMLATQPDMIHDFARAVAARIARAERTPVAVHADVWVSVNGQPARRLVDPAVDLSRETLPDSWLLPGPGRGPAPDPPAQQ